MFNGHDPFPTYARIQLFRAMQIVKKYVKPADLMTEGAPFRLAILLNPLIVFGLTLEDSASLTRAVLLSHFASAITVWVSGGCCALLLCAWINRYIIGKTKATPLWVFPVLKMLGLCTGIIAAIASTSPNGSPTLTLGYWASCFLLFWSSATMSRAVHRTTRYV